MEMVPFSEIAEINPKVKLEKGATFPFVEMAEVESGRRYVAGAAERVMKSGGAKFESGDTLFARITPCLENGKIAQYKNENNARAFGSTEFFVFRAKAQVSDPSFIYYLSLSDYIRGPAVKSMSGASPLTTISSKTTPIASKYSKKWPGPFTTNGSSNSASTATKKSK
jgi:type I restriction enzyme S subunit